MYEYFKLGLGEKTALFNAPAYTGEDPVQQHRQPQGTPWGKMLMGGLLGAGAAYGYGKMSPNAPQMLQNFSKGVDTHLVNPVMSYLNPTPTAGSPKFVSPTQPPANVVPGQVVKPNLPAPVKSPAPVVPPQVPDAAPVAPKPASPFLGAATAPSAANANPALAGWKTPDGKPLDVSQLPPSFAEGSLNNPLYNKAPAVMKELPPLQPYKWSGRGPKPTPEFLKQREIAYTSASNEHLRQQQYPEYHGWELGRKKFEKKFDALRPKYVPDADDVLKDVPDANGALTNVPGGISAGIREDANQAGLAGYLKGIRNPDNPNDAGFQGSPYYEPGRGESVANAGSTIAGATGIAGASAAFSKGLLQKYAPTAASSLAQTAVGQGAGTALKAIGNKTVGTALGAAFAIPPGLRLGDKINNHFNFQNRFLRGAVKTTTTGLSAAMTGIGRAAGGVLGGIGGTATAPVTGPVGPAAGVVAGQRIGGAVGAFIPTTLDSWWDKVHNGRMAQRAAVARADSLKTDFQRALDFKNQGQSGPLKAWYGAQSPEDFNTTLKLYGTNPELQRQVLLNRPQ